MDNGEHEACIFLGVVVGIIFAGIIVSTVRYLTWERYYDKQGFEYRIKIDAIDSSNLRHPTGIERRQHIRGLIKKAIESHSEVIVR